MKSITSVHVIRDTIATALQLNTPKQMAKHIEEKLLHHKIKFPLLEAGAKALHENLSDADSVTLAEALIATETLGALVIAGKLMQLRPEKKFPDSVNRFNHWMMHSDEWYACDILGERVLGHGLLQWPEAGLKQLKKVSQHEQYWVVRSTGVAIHYAVKKGLDEAYVTQCFRLLLQLSNAQHYHIKTGIGWGAKTCAKFHPALVRKMLDETKNEIQPARWFMTKVEIGFDRADYTRAKLARRKTKQ